MSGYLLVTTALPEHQNDKDEFIFLGEWCKVYGVARNKVAKYQTTMEFVWNERANYEKAYNYCNELHEGVLRVLTDFLNIHHGINKDSEYYRIILGIWLIHYLNQVYDKYITLKNAQERFSEIAVVALPKEQWVIPFEYEDYQKRVTESDQYNAQTYSSIASFLEMDLEEIAITKREQQSYRFVRRLSSREKVRSKIDKLFSGVARIRGQQTVLMVNPYFIYDKVQEYKLALSSHFRIAINHFAVPFNIEIGGLDKETRENTHLPLAGDEFKEYLSTNLISQLPIIYLEGFHEFRGAASRIPEYTAKTVFTAMSEYCNTAFQFWFAERQKEKRLIVHQHGGVNGTHLMSQEEVHWKIPDEVWTFGWSDDEKHVPMYHYNCSLARKSFLRKVITRRVLLVMTGQPRYFFRFHSSYSATEMLDYIDSTIHFLQALDASTEVIIRLFPHEYGWNIRERIEEEKYACSITFDDRSKDMLERLEECELMVSDHVGSTYLESIALDVPTVVFCDPEVTRFRDSAYETMSKLKECGILHEDPDSAACHINRIAEQADLWWTSDIVSKTVAEFSERYARVSCNWDKAWIDRFQNYSEA